MRIITVVFVAVMSIALGAAARVDWKYFGSANANDGVVDVFYDATGVKHLSELHVEVWIKAIEPIPTDGKPDDDLVDAAARNLVTGYQPPIEQLKTLTQDQHLNVLVMEAAANLEKTSTRMRMLLEIDCAAMTARTLSVIIYDHGGAVRASSDTVGQWEHNAPETNDANLAALLCR